MKKYGSQVSVALVCCILGFMLSYQFKLISKQDKVFSRNSDYSEINIDIENLNKQKTELQAKVDDLQAKLKTYEQASANKNQVNQQLLDELNQTRMLMGTIDIKGEGIVLTITPQSGLFGKSDSVEPPITDKDLAYIVNYLNAAGAEAVSVNDIRIISRSGISSGGNTIKINDERISPYDKVIIRAIGDKNNLYSAMSFQGAIPEMKNCDSSLSKSENVIIKKYNKKYKYNYSQPVEK